MVVIAYRLHPIQQRAPSLHQIPACIVNELVSGRTGKRHRSGLCPVSRSRGAERTDISGRRTRDNGPSSRSGLHDPAADFGSPESVGHTESLDEV